MRELICYDEDKNMFASNYTFISDSQGVFNKSRQFRLLRSQHWLSAPEVRAQWTKWKMGVRGAVCLYTDINCTTADMLLGFYCGKITMIIL